MARRGVTQELIDETRASTEVQMLRDLQKIASLGGDLEYKDHQGATPVRISSYRFINSRKRKNQIAFTFQFSLQLHIAAANGYLRVVEFLLDQHVSTDVEDNDKWQPVHAAACWGHVSSNPFSTQIIELLEIYSLIFIESKCIFLSFLCLCNYTIF